MQATLVIDSLDSGGAESMVVPFARALDRSRIALNAVGLFDIDAKHRVASRHIVEALDDSGVNVSHIHARNLRDGRAFGRLVALIQEQRSEVLHAQLTFSIIWGAVAARRLGLAWVATLHGLVDPPFGSHRWMWEKLVRVALRRADRVICVSDAVRDFYLSRARLDPERVVTIYNGLELDRFTTRPEQRANLRREWGLDDHTPVIAMVALLRRGKGHDELLSAVPKVLERFPETRFLIVGGGSLERELQATAQPYGHSVLFLGMRDDIPAILAASDLLVLPSHTEALPTVLLEAMAARLPVVATRVGGIPEIVRDGETGTLVRPRDVTGLATAILSYIASPAHARAMGQAGRDRVETLFGSRRYAQQVADLYLQVRSERNSMERSDLSV